MRLLLVVFALVLVGLVVSSWDDPLPETRFLVTKPITVASSEEEAPQKPEAGMKLQLDTLPQPVCSFELMLRANTAYDEERIRHVPYRNVCALLENLQEA